MRARLVKGLSRANRWQRMPDAERIDRGYLGRVLRLTLLAPDIVEAILDGRQPGGLGLPRFIEPIPSAWERAAGDAERPRLA